MLGVHRIDVRQQRTDQRAERRFDDGQLDAALPLFPLQAQRFGLLAIGGDVHGIDHVVRTPRDGSGVGQRLQCDLIERGDRHDDLVTDLIRINRCLGRQFGGRLGVVGVDPTKQDDQ